MADKSELTGKDGGPVEITRIERVIVEAPAASKPRLDLDLYQPAKPGEGWGKY